MARLPVDSLRRFSNRLAGARFGGLALALLAIDPLPALAGEFPTYYRVVDVGADDRLNIRAAPDASADIVDTLAPDARSVEILETADAGGQPWGRLALGEGNGWVAMRYLAPFEVSLIAGTKVPAGLQCSGTEPFWGVRLGGSALDYSAIDSEPRQLSLVTATSAAGRPHRFALVARSENERMTAIISRGEHCSDGMSDADFGWRIDLLMEGGEARQLEGCCRLPR